MKILSVIISIIALALSGCAHTGYRHGYAGYSSGYTVQRYYDDDDLGYYRPSYGHYYAPPRVEHREHEYHHDSDWRQPVPQFHDRPNSSWQDRRERGRQLISSHSHAEQNPNWGGGASKAHGIDFGENHGGDRQNRGWHGRHGE